MVENCCKIVGGFPITADGIISISSKGNTEVSLHSVHGVSAATVAPSTGTVSITAYAGSKVHYGCKGRAGVSVAWQKRSDCNNFIYLFSGYGKSYMSGDVENYVEFPSINGVINPVALVPSINASSGSGPAALYSDSTQEDGYGLIYNGQPWSIDTRTEEGSKVNLTTYGIGNYGECMLQNLELTLEPGKVPTVSMSFIYSISN